MSYLDTLCRCGHEFRDHHESHADEYHDALWSGCTFICPCLTFEGPEPEDEDNDQAESMKTEELRPAA